MTKDEIVHNLDEIIATARVIYADAGDDPMLAMLAMGSVIFDLMTLKNKLKLEE